MPPHMALLLNDEIYCAKVMRYIGGTICPWTVRDVIGKRLFCTAGAARSSFGRLASFSPSLTVTFAGLFSLLESSELTLTNAGLAEADVEDEL